VSEDDACRADLWLWRARFFKTRTIAAEFVEKRRIRLTRGGLESRLDKPSRAIKVGDRLVFALGGRVVAIVVQGLGERRGPAEEARRLYSTLDGGTPDA